jgi:murein tripeptide amidase MpaA
MVCRRLPQPLLDPLDATSRALLDKATFYVVPNMNPDGSILGNLRTNAAGCQPQPRMAGAIADTSPEVLLVRNKMLETGVDLFLDIHGDESLPYVFVAGTEGVPPTPTPSASWKTSSSTT